MNIEHSQNPLIPNLLKKRGFMASNINGLSLSSHQQTTQTAIPTQNSEADAKTNASNSPRKEVQQFHQRVKDIEGLAALWRSQQNSDVPIKMACCLLEEAIKKLMCCAHNKPIEAPINEILSLLPKTTESPHESSNPVNLNSEIGDLINKTLFITTLKAQLHALSHVLEACQNESGITHSDVSKELTTKIRRLQEAAEKASFEMSKDQWATLATEMNRLKERLEDTYTNCTFLDLSNRSLTILPSGLNFPLLTVLRLANNQLADLPNWVSTALSLSTLTINNNEFTALPSQLKLESIPNFDLSHNPWDDNAKVRLKELQRTHKITYSPSGCIRRNSLVGYVPPMPLDSGSPWTPIAMPLGLKFPVPLIKSRSNETLRS